MSKSASAKRWWLTHDMTPTTGRLSGHGPYPHDGVSIQSSFPGAALRGNMVLPQRLVLVRKVPAQPVVLVGHWDEHTTYLNGRKTKVPAP